MGKTKKPKEGDTIQLQNKDGDWETFFVHWVDKDFLILSNFTHAIPCTWKALSKLLSENNQDQGEEQ